MVDALLKEMELRSDYLADKRLESVYFGGGTPSLLGLNDLERIFETIHRLFQVAPDAEITLEANPDDLNRETLRDLRNNTPVNRLSIGIQSFRDADLVWMNRAHRSNEARSCIEQALATGFQDLTIDLIYGAPTTSDEQWQENLATAFDYGIPHLSCYCLTVEEGTALGTFVRRGQQPPVDEEKAARQFEYLIQATKTAGYDHYEISNFAHPGRYARHNSNYWRGAHYLGVGPSAHSFDGGSRQWNISNNALYIKALQEEKVPFEREVLTPEQRFNEYLMTALRTIWGAERSQMEQIDPAFAAHFEQAVQAFLASGTVEKIADTYRLTREGKLLADRIAMELFVDNASGLHNNTKKSPDS